MEIGGIAASFADGVHRRVNKTDRPAADGRNLLIDQGGKTRPEWSCGTRASGAPGSPTLVSPVRMGDCPVMKAARPAVQRVLVGVLDAFEIWSPERYEKVKTSDAIMAQEAFKRME